AIARGMANRQELSGTGTALLGLSRRGRLDDIGTWLRRVTADQGWTFDSFLRLHRLWLRQLARHDRVDQPVIERALRVQIQIRALGVLDNLTQRFARSRR